MVPNKRLASKYIAMEEAMKKERIEEINKSINALESDLMTAWECKDIDKITGFDKTTYAKSELYEYGNKVTYTYNVETKQVAYVSTNEKIGILSEIHNNGFYYYDGNKFIVSTTVAELTSDFYGYGLETAYFKEPIIW